MTANRINWSAKAPLTLGFTALVVLVFGLGGWSMKASIAGAVITSGVVEVKTNRQIVQHPNGGVIAEILVDDGDYVETGEVLVRFDDAFLNSGQLFEISARKSRLIAERDGTQTVQFDQALEDANGNVVIAELMAGQRNQFRARAETLTQEVALLKARGS